MIRVIKEYKVFKAKEDSLDLKAQLVLLVVKGLKVHKVFKVLLVVKEQKVMLVHH